ncbi:MAG: ferritin-like domain-containing protein [Bacteroidales bacterium]
MLKQRIAEALGSYADAAVWSSRFFLSISLQMEYEGYTGFSRWMRNIYVEYNCESLSIIDYILEQGTHTVLHDITNIPSEFGDVPEAFEQGLIQLMRMGDSLEQIVELAQAEKDNTTYTKLQPLLLKQVKTEANISRIISRLKRGGGESGYSLYDYMMQLT